MAELTNLGIFDEAKVRFISQDDISEILSSSPGDISVIYNKPLSDEETVEDILADTDRIFSDIYITGKVNEGSDEKAIRHIAGGYGFNSIELKNWFEENKEALEEIVNNIETGNDVPLIKEFNLSFSTGLGTFSNKSNDDTIYLRIPLQEVINEENENNIKITVTGMYFHYYFPNESIEGKLFLTDDSTNFIVNSIGTIGFKKFTPNPGSVYGEKQFIRQEIETNFKENIWRDKLESYEVDENNGYTIYPLTQNDLLRNRLEKRFIFVIRYSRNNDANYEYQILLGPKVVFEYPILTYSCSAELFETVQIENIVNTRVNFSQYNEMVISINSPLYTQTREDFAKPETHYIYVPETQNVKIISNDSNIRPKFVEIENQSLGINTDIEDYPVYYKIYKSPVQYLGTSSWILKNIK